MGGIEHIRIWMESRVWIHDPRSVRNSNCRRSTRPHNNANDANYMYEDVQTAVSATTTPFMSRDLQLLRRV